MEVSQSQRSGLLDEVNEHIQIRMEKKDGLNCVSRVETVLLLVSSGVEIAAGCQASSARDLRLNTCK